MDTHVYIGFKSCGCGVAVVVDDPKRRKDVGKSVASFVSERLTVERVTMEEYPARFKGCKCLMVTP